MLVASPSTRAFTSVSAAESPPSAGSGTGFARSAAILSRSAEISPLSVVISSDAGAAAPFEGGSQPAYQAPPPAAASAITAPASPAASAPPVPPRGGGGGASLRGGGGGGGGVGFDEASRPNWPAEVCPASGRSAAGECPAGKSACGFAASCALLADASFMSAEDGIAALSAGFAASDSGGMRETSPAPSSMVTGSVIDLEWRIFGDLTIGTGSACPAASARPKGRTRFT